MADLKGFEPLTFASVVRRSNPTELQVRDNQIVGRLYQGFWANSSSFLGWFG